MNLNTEIRYVIFFYVRIYCSCMEEPQLLPISFTISEFILIEFMKEMKYVSTTKCMLLSYRHHSRRHVSAIL